jgi:argininosuccinate lyase
MMPSEQVWRGRVVADLEPSARALNDSLPVDRRLWPEEIELSRAWAQVVAEAGVLAPSELVALLGACDTLERDLGEGRVALEGEDVHSAVEAALTARCGDAARRLHTGRSRNDQVATLLRMRVMRLCDEAVEGVRALERALVAQARTSGDRVVAAYTHLQPAQAVRLAHWWLAHVAALERDETRFQAVREAADLLPLGAGAVAGTPLVHDRLGLAARLGFSRLAANSIDAVGDRDFALEYLDAAALLGLHLSRLAEDLVLACSPGFGWFRAPDGFSTGSSLLPQKRNPDIFELARGKSGRLLANAQRLAVVLKGLPSAYQKDLQEDKEAVFDTADTLATLLDALPAAIAAIETDDVRLRASLTPDLLAVELADALVAAGEPFREAHAAVGRLWAEAERAGVAPRALTEAVRLALSPHFTGERLAGLSFEASLARRDHAPGTGPTSVAAQLARHVARLGLDDGDPEDEEIALPRPVRRAARGLLPAGPAPGRDAPVPASVRGIRLRRAAPRDAHGIGRLTAGYVAEGTLLPRPVNELFQCLREFHVAVDAGGEVVACAALRLLWDDLGEVRTLAVRPDHHGNGLGAQLVARVLEDARGLGLERVIALTREVAFFERCGFAVVARDALPRKVWADCIRCPRRHACDEVAVSLELAPHEREAGDAAAEAVDSSGAPGRAR